MQQSVQNRAFIFLSAMTEKISLHIKLFALALLSMPIAAMAWKSPTSGSLGYFLYKVGVVDMAQGAPGFTGAVLLAILAIARLNTSWMQSGLSLLGSAGLFNIEDIVTSLGATIDTLGSSI
ncbi:hypothetical protein [Dickeya sp. NCPPB 3274]|uniref:hypothetical protein n=1 Tax=Dickeya sp. NCPPB 3274 TaxID=568766 RepID=UPI0005B37CB5|nr:hypothetical protein [Dickeya sp. NCPPB 3274]